MAGAKTAKKEIRLCLCGARGIWKPGGYGGVLDPLMVGVAEEEHAAISGSDRSGAEEGGAAYQERKGRRRAEQIPRLLQGKPLASPGVGAGVVFDYLEEEVWVW